MPSPDYKPRFSCEISMEQKKRVDKLLNQFGVKKAFFGPILDDILDLVEKHGEKFIVAITAKMATPNQLIPSMREAKEIVEKVEGLSNG